MERVSPALRTHELAAAGVSDHESRSPGWQQISHGLHAPYGTCAGLRSRAEAILRMLPTDAAYGHLTAAALRGWALPWLPAQMPLIASSRSTTHVQREDVYVRRCSRNRAVAVHGVPALAPIEILLDCAAQDLGLIDLVALADSGCRVEQLDPGPLAAAVPRGARGAGRLRGALALADPRAESWYESVLRLVHVLSGITQVEVQDPIEDGGVVVARADLRLRGTRRLVEYDGADHRRRKQQHADLRREKMLSRLGFDRYGYVEPEIAHSPGMIVGDAELALGLLHRPARVRGWWRHAHQSTITSRGRLHLEQRLERFLVASLRPDRPRRP